MTLNKGKITAVPNPVISCPTSYTRTRTKLVETSRTTCLNLVYNSTLIVTIYFSHLYCDSLVFCSLNFLYLLTGDKITRYISLIQTFSNFPSQQSQRTTINTYHRKRIKDGNKAYSHFGCCGR